MSRTNHCAVFGSTLKEHAIDCVVCLVVFGAAALCNFLMPPYDSFFIERDPRLSNPWINGADEEVPDFLVIILSIPVVMLIIFGLQLFFVCTAKNAFHPRALNFFLAQLAFLEAIGMNFFLTVFLKSFVGRKRPNFFDYCNYQGYREALQTGNFTEYFALTVPGIPGSLDKCLDTTHIRDAQFSFPSGHSSFITCGFGFAGLFGMYMFNRFSKKHNMTKGLYLLVMIYFAFIVAATRPRDYWHNYDDILAGGCLGFGCALFAYLLNFHPSLHPPRDLSDDVYAVLPATRGEK